MKKDPQDERIESILGENLDSDFDQAVEAFYEYNKAHLLLPCEVTGIEDFRWEEFYVLGPGSKREYDQLKKTQPSYRDRYTLFDISRGTESQWMLFPGEDITAMSAASPTVGSSTLGCRSSRQQIGNRRTASFSTIILCGSSTAVNRQKLKELKRQLQVRVPLSGFQVEEGFAWKCDI